MARRVFAIVTLVIAVAFFLIGQSVQNGGRIILSQSIYLVSGIAIYTNLTSKFTEASAQTAPLANGLEQLTIITATGPHAYQVEVMRTDQERGREDVADEHRGVSGHPGDDDGRGSCSRAPQLAGEGLRLDR